MSVITGANLKALVDSIGKQKQLLDGIIGAEATADTILYGMQQNVTRIEGYDEDVIADAHKQFVAQKELMPSFKLDLNHKSILALENHIQRINGVSLGEYWQTENYPTDRIPPEFAEICRSIGLYIPPTLVWSYVTNLGSFLVTGVGAGTFTDLQYVDGNLYGECDAEGIVTAVGNVSVTGVATVTGTDQNGSVVTGTITFSASALNDVVAFVPDQAGARLMDVTNITIANFETDDAFTVRTKVDRALTL